MYHGMPMLARGQLTGVSSLPSTMWVLSIKLRSSGLVTSPFTCHPLIHLMGHILKCMIMKNNYDK